MFWLLKVVVVLSFATATEEFPSYEQDLKVHQSKLEENKAEAPSIRENFMKDISAKMQEVTKYVRTQKDALMKTQEQKRKDFEATLQKELADWRASNPGKSATEFMKKQNERRVAFLKEWREERKQAETKITEKKGRFETFVKGLKEDFQKRYREYSKTSEPKAAAKTDQAGSDEFKEIPKGPATKLSPHQNEKN